MSYRNFLHCFFYQFKYCDQNQTSGNYPYNFTNYANDLILY